MIQEALVSFLELVLGSTEGLTTAVTLAFGAHYLRKTARVGGLINTLSWFAVLLGVLVALGAVDVHPSVLANLLAAAFNALAGLF